MRALSQIGVRIDLLVIIREAETPIDVSQPPDDYNYDFVSAADIEELYRLHPRCVPPDMRPSADCDAAGFIATQGTSIPQSVDSRQSWAPAKRASGYTFGCSANGRRALRSDGTAKYIPIQL